MGTSRGYKAPTGGSWPALKGLVTGFGNEENDPPPLVDPVGDPQPIPPPLPFSPQMVLSRYLQAHSGGTGQGAAGGAGGAAGSAGGSSGGDGSRARGLGRSAPRVGRNLGGFVTRVDQVGLDTALREYDLGELVGRPAEEVARGIVERLCGPGTTMDVVIAQVALNRLWKELLAGAKTAADVERRLREVVAQQRVSSLVVRFYGHYIFEKFCRDFSERLAKSAGAERTRSKIDTIRRTIFASLRAKIGQRDAGAIDWRGAEGLRIATTILDETAAIFTATA